MPGFLTAVGHYGIHGGQEENQLSATFCACFNESRGFRAAIVPMLWKRLIGGPPPPGLEWDCRTQVPAPSKKAGEKGFFDIVIQPSAPDWRHRGRRIRFVIENKVKAPLTKPQLDKYKGTERHLVTITRRYPEIAPHDLQHMRIVSLRWHDIHHALSTARAFGARDRFLLDEFLRYLEDSRMGSHTISQRDFTNIQSMFRQIVREGGSTAVNLLAFGTAQALVDLVDEIRRDATPSSGKKGKLKHWGPGYYKEDYNDGRGIVHQIGFSIHTHWGHKSDRWVEFYFAFPEKAVRRPFVWAGLTVPTESSILRLKEWPIRQLLKRGQLDRVMLDSTVIPHLRRCLSEL